jgi:hypothetical protein
LHAIERRELAGIIAPGGNKKVTDPIARIDRLVGGRFCA